MPAMTLARKLFVYVALVATLFVSTTDAQELKTVANEDIWRQRPADMFRMASNNEPTVCNPLLASINEKKVITERRPHPIIQNRFVINPWRKQSYSWTNASNGRSYTRSWEVADVDLDGDGVKDGVFRDERSMKQNPYHAIWFVHSIDSHLVTEPSLSENETSKITKSENGIYLKRPYRNQNFGPSFVEVVSVENKNYLLLFSAFYWARKTLDRYPFIYVLKRDATQFHQICQFEGIIKVMRGAPNWNQ